MGSCSCRPQRVVKWVLDDAKGGGLVVGVRRGRVGDFQSITKIQFHY